MVSLQAFEKPHVVCMPFQAQGHINPMLKVATLLYHKGFHVTFIHTEHNYERLLKSRGVDSLSGLPDFRFETIPDGLPPAGADVTHDLTSLYESTSKNCLAPFRKLLEKLNDDSCSSRVPPVTSIVYDATMSFPIIAAQEIGVPCVSLGVSNACYFMSIKQYRQFVEKCLIPVRDASSLDTTIDWIPGMKNIRLKDISLRTLDPNSHILHFILEAIDRASQASAIIFNTFDALDGDILNALSSTCSRVFAIGPLQLLIDQLPQNKLKSIGSNLWKEELECLQWLNLQEPNSVVYVNFGSTAVLTRQQLIEFAWGLANSKHNFLWIIRPDLVEDENATLPPEFAEETEGRGMFAGWCPQEQVLSHPSVAGFLTHCGWNSVVESLCSGVPMICWPFFADHPIICRYLCNEWGVGMEVENIERDEVERLVRELMDGKEGKEKRKRALEWKIKAEEATNPNGSSSLNLDKLVNVLLSK